MAPGTSSRSRRKQQTRLSFDPVEEVASQSAMSQAKVRYEVPGATRRFTHRTSKQNPMIEETRSPGKQVAVTTDKSPRLKKGLVSSQTLPQMLSSQTHGLTAEVKDLDLQDLDNNVKITSSKSRKPPKSSKKAGSRQKSPSPMDLSLIPAGTSGFMPRTSKQAKFSRYAIDSDMSSSEGSAPEEDEQVLPKRSSQNPVAIDDDSDELAEESTIIVTPKRGKSKLPKSSASGVKDKVAASSNIQKRKTPSLKKETSNRSAQSISILDDEDESEDEIVLPSARKPPRSTDQQFNVGFDEDSDDVFEPIRSSQRSRKVVAEDDGDSDDLPLIPSTTILGSSGRQNLRPTTLTKRKRSSSTEQSGDDFESDAAPSSKKRRHQSSQDEPSSDDFEVEDEPVSSARKLKGKDKARAQDEQETRVTRARVDKKPKRTAKQKQMELLKRRRAGENIDAVTDSSSEEEVRGAIYDTDSEQEALVQFDDESQDEGIEAVARSLRPDNRNDFDDSFVVEDDEAPLGAPGLGLNDIPLEFTHHAHKRLKDHFRDIVEWMVQNKINPGFERNDPIYRLAFRKVDDEARGFANSKFSSSSWKTNFTRALWSRPVLLEDSIESGNANEGRKCDACGRSGHPAKFILQFQGSPYDQDTLEDIVNDSTDDDSDNGSNSNSNSDSEARTRRQRVERNREGHRIPAAETAWYVGRFCKANAESAHALVHWRHSLNDWVVAQLENEGYMSPSALASRAKLSKKKLSKRAVRIVDDWEKRGEIKSLYKSFRDTLSSARESTQNRWNH